MVRSASAGRRAKPELLAPGGSLEKCRIAFIYGADAVYAGWKQYSLRAAAQNLNREELAAISHLAHKLGKKLYITVNIFARDSDLAELPSFLRYLQDIRVHGIILSDPGVLALAKRWAPNVPLHLSTQANTTNSPSIQFWREQGIERVNVARELTFAELEQIRKHTDIELEIFIHGAMCVSYSGRCLLSALLNQRSANRGSCTQPCRWFYRLVEEKRPGQYFPIYEDPQGSYIFNSKDLCLITELGKLMGLGIDAFKIEGRMKGSLYLASVLRAYRQAIDAYWQFPVDYRVERAWLEDLERVSHRPYTKRFLFPNSDEAEAAVSASVPYVQTHTLAGIVRQAPQMHCHDEPMFKGAQMSLVCLQVRSQLQPGATLEFLFPGGGKKLHMLTDFTDLHGNPLTIAHPNSWIQFDVPFDVFPLQVVSVRRSALG